MLQPKTDVKHIAPGWKGLYLAGGAAANLAGLIFRRNLAVEIALFHPVRPPAAAGDWFALLQSDRLLGLAYYGIFDILNYMLVGLMLMALYAALRRHDPARSALGLGLGFLGAAVYFSTNTALSMLSLSNQYATAASEAQRTLLLAAGQTLLALNRFSSPGAQPGSGGYLSLFLVAAAGLLFSIAMLRSNIFLRLTAYVGMAANGLDLLYCLVFPFTPASMTEQLGTLFLPAAGLFFMVWHLMTGWGLFRLWQRTAQSDEEARTGRFSMKITPKGSVR